MKCPTCRRDEVHDHATLRRLEALVVKLDEIHSVALRATAPAAPKYNAWFKGQVNEELVNAFADLTAPAAPEAEPKP